MKLGNFAGKKKLIKAELPEKILSSKSASYGIFADFWEKIGVLSVANRSKSARIVSKNHSMLHFVTLYKCVIYPIVCRKCSIE